MTSKFYHDIIRQPEQWAQCLAYCFSEGKAPLQQAATQILGAKKVVVSGIGASYSAGMALEFLLKGSGIHATLEDSSELMQQFTVEKDDVLLLLSRSGKSVELLKVLDLAKLNGATVICICNDATSPLATQCDTTLLMNVDFDHAISVNTYSAILLVGIILDQFCRGFEEAFEDKAAEAVASIHRWLRHELPFLTLQQWIRPDAFYYFLARADARAASQAAVLLWEEGVKMPATAKTTGSFRHGPQEVITPNMQVMIWLDEKASHYGHDLQLCRDLKSLEVQVLMVGTFQDALPEMPFVALPELPNPFQILAQQIPAQLAAHYLALEKGVDADTFKYCNYIVQTEGGIW